MKTIITLDKANQPYGFPQLNSLGNFDNVIFDGGITSTTLNLTSVVSSATDTHYLTIDNTGRVHFDIPYSGGASLYWYAENAIAPVVAPVATGTGSIALGDGAEALIDNMFVYGTNAGQGASNAYSSNFMGLGAGQGATDAYDSNFFGQFAGYQAINASRSNFIGTTAGANATGASYSNIMGYKAGYAPSSSDSIGNNNIIIGNNISLPSGTTNSINLGGILFGINAYSATTGNPSIVPVATGRIGIGVVTPTNTLHVSGLTDPLRIEGLQSGNTNNRILTSDINGVIKYTDLSLVNGTGNYLPLSGGTVSGETVFTSGLTATTISATTYQNLPLDIYVTGGTYSNNAFTYTNNTGGTYSVLFNTLTGLTVNGNLSVTGNTSLQELTATTISATTYLNLPQSGVTAFNARTGNVTLSATDVTTALTFTPYDATNPSRYITSSSLSGLALDSSVVHIANAETITGTKTFLATAAGDTSPNIELLSDANITVTSGWSGSFSAGYTHAASGGITALDTSLLLTAGNYYRVSYIITGRTAGTVNTTVNGVTPTNASSASLSYVYIVNPSVSGVLAFVPTTTFDGNIVVSVKQVSNPTLILGTSTGDNSLEIRAGGYTNVVIGNESGASSGAANFLNVFLGYQAGASATNNFNTAIGSYALRNIVTATFPNVAIGYGALQYLNSGLGANTAIGVQTLGGTTSGQYNTGIGYNALFSNTTGNENSAFGQSASFRNTTGINNVAFGRLSLFNNVTGSSNVAIGYEAGYNNTASSKFYISNSRTVNLIHGDFSTGQVQINPASTPVLTASAALEVISTTRGMLIPKMTTTQRDAVVTPVAGLSVYNTTLNTNDYYNGTNWVSTLAPDTTGLVNISGTTQTGSSAVGIMNLTQTWNTSGNPTAIKLNVNNTASGVSALLIDLQVSGATMFNINKGGGLYSNGSISTGGSVSSYRFQSVSPINIFHNQYFYLSGNITYNVAGTSIGFQNSHGFVQASGTANYIAIAYDGTINQTGGASGITRGVYINPTLTSAADFRAIEMTNSTGYGLYQSGGSTTSNYLNGNTGIGTTATTLSAGAKLIVRANTSNFVNPVVNFQNSNGSDVVTFYTGGGASYLNYVRIGATTLETTYALNVNPVVMNATVGTTGIIVASTIFNPISGTAIQNFVTIGGSINQTGGASGITRGLLIAPTLTSAFDYRAIETTQGSLVMNDTYLVSGTTGTTSSPLLNLSQTWNKSGATPTAIKLNVTDSGSTASSLLMDLQTGGVSQFKVDKSGNVTSSNLITAGNGVASDGFLSSNGNGPVLLRFKGNGINGTGSLGKYGIFLDNANSSNILNGTTGNFDMVNISITTYQPTSGTQTFNILNLANTINQTGTATGITRGIYINPTLSAATDFRAIETTKGSLVMNDTYLVSGTTGTTSSPLLNLSQTWNKSGATPTAILLNVTDTASDFNSSSLIDLQLGGSSVFNINKNGFISFGTYLGNNAKITPANPVTSSSLKNGTALGITGNVKASVGYDIFLIGGSRTTTSGVNGLVNISQIIAPTSGTGDFNTLLIAPTVNQTGGASGVTRGIYINPTLSAATNFRAIEIVAGKLVYSSTITTTGTTGAQTINKISGKVNAAAATTSLVVTNSLVTASSIVMCQLGTNDATCIIKSVVEAAGSFTINYAAPTTETVIKFFVIN